MAQRGVTRREVLDLSAELFADRGYRSTSLELVAAGLGVTRQALYYHFRSKSEILGALFDELMTKLELGILAVQPAPGEPRFGALVRAHVETTVSNTRLMALLLHERPETERMTDLHASRRRRAYDQQFIEAYEEGVAAGQLLPVDPWVAVNTVIAAINGVSWWHHGESRSNRTTRREIQAHLQDLLASGFLLKPADLPSEDPLRI